jgi:hypothetical protein
MGPMGVGNPSSVSMATLLLSTCQRFFNLCACPCVGLYACMRACACCMHACMRVLHACLHGRAADAWACLPWYLDVEMQGSWIESCQGVLHSYVCLEKGALGTSHDRHMLQHVLTHTLGLVARWLGAMIESCICSHCIMIDSSIFSRDQANTLCDA